MGGFGPLRTCPFGALSHVTERRAGVPAGLVPQVGDRQGDAMPTHYARHILAQESQAAILARSFLPATLLGGAPDAVRARPRPGTDPLVRCSSFLTPESRPDRHFSGRLPSDRSAAEGRRRGTLGFRLAALSGTFPDWSARALRSSSSHVRRSVCRKGSMAETTQERAEALAIYLDGLGATSGAELVRTLAERLRTAEQERDEQVRERQAPLTDPSPGAVSSLAPRSSASSAGA